MIVILVILTCTAGAITTGSRCHIQIEDKIFFLTSLEAEPYYLYQNDQSQIFLFNFCSTAEPPSKYACQAAYSVVLYPANNTCERYASDSPLYMYDTQLFNQSGQYGITIIEQSGIPVAEGSGQNRTTQLIILCDYNGGKEFSVSNVSLDNVNGVLTIMGSSSYGCPVLQMSSLWEALSDNQVIFGIVMLVVGVTELFFGRKMLQPTIFIAAYCLSFAVLGAIASELIVKPDSSLIVIYMTLLLILFVSSCVAYLVMGASYISVFCVGAWMGLIVAALANSIFIKIFKVYSVWSLVGFAIVFCLLLGILSYRMYNHIIILSTSLTGAYMIIRPISWIFGGFPNEFMLADQIRAGELPTLPSIFFLYFTLILILMIIGVIYQFLQLRREQAKVKDSAIEIGLVEGKIQAGVDSVRNSVNALINRYRINDEEDDARAGQYIQFQQFHKLDGEKPLYPHLESQLGGKQLDRKSGRNSLREDISISNSFLREMSEQPKQFGEEQPHKQQSRKSTGPRPTSFPQDDPKINTDSEDSKPSRDSNNLSKKLEGIRNSGSRFSKQHLLESEQPNSEPIPLIGPQPPVDTFEKMSQSLNNSRSSKMEKSRESL